MTPPFNLCALQRPSQRALPPRLTPIPVASLSHSALALLLCPTAVAMAQPPPTVGASGLVTVKGDGWKCTYPFCNHPAWKRLDQKRNWESHWLHEHRASEEFMNHFLPEHVARLSQSRQQCDKLGVKVKRLTEEVAYLQQLLEQRDETLTKLESVVRTVYKYAERGMQALDTSHPSTPHSGFAQPGTASPFSIPHSTPSTGSFTSSLSIPHSTPSTGSFTSSFAQGSDLGYGGQSPAASAQYPYHHQSTAQGQSFHPGDIFQQLPAPLPAHSNSMPLSFESPSHPAHPSSASHPNAQHWQRGVSLPISTSGMASVLDLISDPSDHADPQASAEQPTEGLLESDMKSLRIDDSHEIPHHQGEGERLQSASSASL